MVMPQTRAVAPISIWKPWQWLGRLPAVVVQETSRILRDFRLSWRILWALTVIESRRKYAGSILGMLWYPVYSGLLLASYCFVYLVVFRVRFAEFGTYGFVLFVFSGLIPYLGFSEAVATSTPSVRQSINILKNAVFPVEFVPVRFVCASLFGLLSSLAILVLMILPTHFRGWHFIYLPFALGELFVFCLTIAWVLSAIAVIVPDIVQLVNIALMLLMFVSPVGYPVDMVPMPGRLLVYLNPLTYLIEAFRFSLLGIRHTPMWIDPLFLVCCLATASLAGAFFIKLSPIFADYE
jgi:lipopolysaccharide transport system permease protein